MRILLAWCLAAALLAVRGSSAAASPSEDLAKARELYRAGDCAGAVPTLTYLLYPDPRLAASGDLVEAHVLLGVCHLSGGDRRAALSEFEEALFLSPELTLDTLLFSAEAIAVFDKKKSELALQAQRDTEARAVAEERDRLRRALENLVVIEKRPYYVNFIPFGAGQFQNGDTKKALWFAASQGITGGASAAIFTYLWLQYGFGGKVPPDEAGFVRQLQQIEIATGGACLILMGWGIVDSLRNYEPTVQRKPDESYLPDAPAASSRGRGARPTITNFSLSPTLLPHGAGASLRLEF